MGINTTSKEAGRPLQGDVENTPAQNRNAKAKYPSFPLPTTSDTHEIDPYEQRKA
jgi:hypothetical protein